MFKISVAAEPQAPLLWDVCVHRDDRQQRTEVNISLPGAARTVVSIQFDALFQCRTTAKGEMSWASKHAHIQVT